MSKAKTVKAWGWVRDGELVENSFGLPWVMTTREIARSGKLSGERVVRLQAVYRILPNPGKKRSA